MNEDERNEVAEEDSAELWILEAKVEHRAAPYAQKVAVHHWRLARHCVTERTLVIEQRAASSGEDV